MSALVSPVWYFAYGSNMETATFQGRRGISFSRALPARASGWRIVFDKPPVVPGGGAVANIVTEPAGVVFGVLYEITPEHLAHVELTEGVLIGNYHRVEMWAESLAAPASRRRLRASPPTAATPPSSPPTATWAA